MLARTQPRRTLLALAGVLLTALLGCQNGCTKSAPLPHLGRVPEFSLVDQNGEPFGSSRLLGKPHVVSFMFTRCPSICPAVTAKKKAVLELARAQAKRLGMVSISIDGDNDTPPVLLAYAREHGLDLGAWTLLTGDAKQIAAYAEQSFKIAVSGQADATKADFGLTHGSHLVLVDAAGDIRGYYASMDEGTPRRLVSDLDRL